MMGAADMSNAVRVPSDPRMMSVVKPNCPCGAPRTLSDMPAPLSELNAGKNVKGPRGRRVVSLMTASTLAFCQMSRAKTASDASRMKHEIPVTMKLSPLRVDFACDRFVSPSPAANCGPGVG